METEAEPGAPAPWSGPYHELNVFGTHTGRVHHAVEGETLPDAPRGFTWRLVSDPRVASN